MNYYELLNLSKNATQSEIKSSYKKLVKKYHPDLYSGDKNFAEQKIKQINEAYDVLSNPEKKITYDETLKTPLENDFSTSENIIYHSTNQTSESIFTNFLSEKLNQLNAKHQIQIFIIIFILTLALFLTNLFHLKDYLIFPSENVVNTTNITNSISSTNSNFQESNNFNDNQNDLNSLDILLNDYLKSYFEEDFNQYEF